MTIKRPKYFKAEERFQKRRMRRSPLLYGLFKFQRPLSFMDANPQVLVYNEDRSVQLSLDYSTPGFVQMFEDPEGMFSVDKFYAHCWFDAVKMHMEFDASKPIIRDPEEWPAW